MLLIKEFEYLLSKSESSTLDFKRELYDFENDRTSNSTAKFVKDIISFSNTIRNESAYIIFGIGESDDKIELNGISKSIDDSILQEKAKSSIFPSPEFAYYTLQLDNKNFGIIEIPIKKHELPLSATKKLKGLEVGKIYYRNGSSNTEANGMDAIRINDWFRSLPGSLDYNSINDEVSGFITRLAGKNEKLSVIMSELMALGKKHNLTELTTFCSAQFKDMNSEMEEHHKYRVKKVFGSMLKAEFNPNPYTTITQDKLKAELNENKDFYRVSLFFHQTLIEIENNISRITRTSGVSIAVLTTNTNNFLEMDKDYPFYLYLLEDDYETIYSTIRQKTIDLLMDI
ncbi:MAG: helix-turn-helix domain-containing protein [Kordia sp.]|uniref:AlbA family DNA-binding domain-containing protein n=1 Tax=Kordia sp. TaxID=1965332 RepID=UPI00385BCB23